jgi:DNA-binding response OmpR family regulator
MFPGREQQVWMVNVDHLKGGFSMKILVVEDDRRLRTLVRKGLESKGHVIDLAQNAEEGRRLAADGHYDVMILDVKLPDTNGVTLCTDLRNQGLKTPILMLTARDSVGDKVLGLTAGADDYMTKPFSFEELAARLIALVRRPPQMVADRVLKARDLVLNMDTCEVHKNDVPISLTRKEFAVLELLMRHPNQVLNRETILDRVWETDFEPAANVVDAVIARLRTKLMLQKKEKPLIKTVRGLGYKITV